MAKLDAYSVGELLAEVQQRMVKCGYSRQVWVVRGLHDGMLDGCLDDWAYCEDLQRKRCERIDDVPFFYDYLRQLAFLAKTRDDDEAG